MKNYFLRVILLAIIPALFCTCTRYYRVQTLAQSTAQSKLAAIDSLDKQRKYFMMHINNTVHGINNISINTTDSTITGFLTSVPVEHSLYLHPHRHFIFGELRTYEKSEAGILNEVHLYSMNAIRDTAFNIPVQDIQKIEAIEYNKQKTTTVNTIGIIITVGAVVALIVVFIGLSQWQF